MNKLKLFLMLISLLNYSTAYARHAEILIDADNGVILHELESSQSWYPASLTKLMTIYMAFDALKAGQVQLNDRMGTSSWAARQPQSRLGLSQGDTLSVEEAILALITRSANDAAVALAEYLGGTEENFAVKMTAKARALGMNDSYFMNATGLPNDLQVTTARDMGLLAWRTLRDFPNYYSYFSAPGLQFKGRQLNAINKFTKTYPGAEGMKTGFTCGSGYNLISSASQNGKRLMGVILGGMSSPQRYQLMVSMMNNGFSRHYSGSKSISSPSVMSTSSTPPYQLDCGRHVGVSVASVEDNHLSPVAYRPLAHYRAHRLKSFLHKPMAKALPTRHATRFSRIQKNVVKKRYHHLVTTHQRHH